MVNFKQKVEWSRRSGEMGEDDYYTVTMEGVAKDFDPDDRCNILVRVSLDIRDISEKHAESVASELAEQDTWITTRG